MTSKKERAHSVVLECIRCKVAQPEIKVKKEDYDQWADNGRLIQVAMPYLSANEREMLITQLCPSCWEQLYAPEAELKQFNVSFTVKDVTSLPSWRHGNNKKLAEKFLKQHLNLLRDSLRDEGKMFLESLLSTWEGPNP
jgi:hypothetical protein